MLKDPQAGRDGCFPYDVLAKVGISPKSSMKEILDASYQLMEQGRWTPEVRRAWDELRMVERRLGVDVLLYDVDVGVEVARTVEAIRGALQDQSKTDAVELFGMDWVLHEIELDAVDVPDITEFDRLPPLPGADIVEFDQ